MNWLRPRASLTTADVHQAKRLFVYDGLFFQLMFTLTTGPFIVAYALHMGANNIVIGLLAAIMPLSQIAQIPSILLVERVRMRRLLVVVSAAASRVAWVPVVLIPWLVAPEYRVTALLGLLTIHYVFAAVAGCAFSSWIRDVIPVQDVNRFFGVRMAVATFFGAMASVGGAIFVDYAQGRFSDPITPYNILFLVASVAGLAGAAALARTPEPAMVSNPDVDFVGLLKQPFHDPVFRRLLVFLGWWNFAINFAVPFFAVYLIERIHLSMTWVLGLTVLGQLTNVVFYRVWGRFADMFSNKSVLLVCGPLFITSFLLWPFTTLPEPHALTMTLLVFIHVLFGMSQAGVTLCTSNIALKSAPHGRATSYLAVNALITGLAAMTAPILAGAAAEWYDAYELKLIVDWSYRSTGETGFSLAALDLRGLDFTFVVAFLLGMYALHRLMKVREDGEVEDKVVIRALVIESAGLARRVTASRRVRMPYMAIRQMMRRRIGG
ncbi:MAG: hypothetical protein AMXMBFR84_06130 [Candidatus Hydrogenedentota bacterium]